MVRVAENHAAAVKRVLDLGAEGIVFPLIRDAAEAAAAVASPRCAGPAALARSSRWGTGLADYRARIEDDLVAILLIETVGAICAVPGIDLIVLAQFDLSAALGVSGQFDPPDFRAALARIEGAALAAGLPMAGIAFSAAQAAALFARGYRMIAGFDILGLCAEAAALRAWAAAG